ncbi:LysM peptidoglycan-binding domain-containing protein [uncultured Oscillibacter sp.]|uniref:LysM peptidoglycan-binding domain-containing protein n=1 Tax=uncultured Oscillibacter sp. TaxID=876091 RepID=UPI0025F3E144|nr:LysM peptidoglycan-binding domain-containing protein [uncultured Oscillibacter sp.]
MTIHVVGPGETVDTIAAGYGVSPRRLASDNGLPEDLALAVGQTLVVRFPRGIHAVTAGETLTSIAEDHGTTVRQLWRNNWELGGGEDIQEGQALVISYFDEKLGEGVFNGYAYPFISPELLAEQLPYLSTLAPFTYGITAEGGLLPLDDEAMLEAAWERGTRPVMHLSTLTEAGQFDTGRATFILTDYEAQGRLAAEVLQTVLRKGYAGLDVDFEYLPGQLAEAYAAFLGRLRQLLAAQGKFLWAALAPKTDTRQRGLLYEGHDYAAVSAAVDGVLLMTYGCRTLYTVFHVLFGFAGFCRKTPDISGIFRERVYELQITL